jgi:hypothetical protein
MRTDFNTTLQIIDEAGTLSGPDGLRLSVLFDLIEMEDIDSTTHGRKFSYGNLRFRDRLESSVVSLFLSKSRLTLTGGGIQAQVRLYSLSSFTVTGAILECRVDGKRPVDKSQERPTLRLARSVGAEKISRA